MLLEALVFTVCVQNNGGCSESTSAYYKQSLSLQDLNDRLQTFSQNMIHDKEWIVYIGTPRIVTGKQIGRAHV